METFLFRRRFFRNNAGISHQPKKNQKYSELIGKGVINREIYPEGIIPEVHQIPLNLGNQAFLMLRQREVTGKLNKPTTTYAMEKVDYTRLDKDESLQEVALADPMRALESHFNKMLTIRRKKYT